MSYEKCACAEQIMKFMESRSAILEQLDDQNKIYALQNLAYMDEYVDQLSKECGFSILDMKDALSEARSNIEGENWILARGKIEKVTREIKNELVKCKFEE